jgi:hypothetical protein
MSDEQRRRDLHDAADLMLVADVDVDGVIRRAGHRVMAESAGMAVIAMTVCISFGWIALSVRGALWHQDPLSGVLAPPPQPVNVSSAISGRASVAPASPVVIHFDRPMDHAAVAAALHVSPATAFRAAWRGSDLILTPLHGLVPDSIYILTIDHTRARSSTGAPLPVDLHVGFGTAPIEFARSAAPSPVHLPVSAVAPADDGSEAVVASDGSLIATSASRYGFAGLLRLHPDGIVEALGPSTTAICVSRSGRSLAYLNGSGAGAAVVMASGDGSGGQAVPVAVDGGSPLGWINDERVSFVAGGQLRAVDRAGHVSVLSSTRIDAARDTVVIAPGGRYVFLRSASASSAPGQGQLLDLATRTSHPLQGIVGKPAFSADGGTVIWVDGSDPSPRLARTASTGGPVLTLPLPLVAGDQVTDLGISRDGSRLIQSVKHPNGDTELRLAALADGATVAVAPGEHGESPSWSPTGNQVAVLGHPGSGPQIDVVDIPPETADPFGSAEALATVFANAQVDGDQDAMRDLSAAKVDVGRLPSASRASVVEVGLGPSGTAQVGLRLLLDPTPAHPAVRAATETLDLRPDSKLGRLVVEAADAMPVADLSTGPHLVRIASGAKPGTVTATFDSDLDPGSVSGAVELRSVGGGLLPVNSTYDAATRSVTLSSPFGLSGSLALTVGTGLRDVAGQHLAASVQAPVVAAGP